MNNSYKPPKFEGDSFNCPYCGAYSHMKWYNLFYAERGYICLNEWSIAQCSCCNNRMFWFEDKMVYPDIITAPMPHIDMPQDIKDIYLEAREISNKSPKGASALLRLALQMLCNQLVNSNKTINDMIGELVKMDYHQHFKRLLMSFVWLEIMLFIPEL